MHGGTVEAQSDGPGLGSLFLVRLPLHRPTEIKVAESLQKTEPNAAAAAAPRPSRGRRVLVVDDNVAWARSLAMVLEFEGHQVRLVHDGPTALTAINDGFDIIFMDIGLPGMDGFEVARRLRERPELAGLPLAAVTGYAEEEARKRSRAAGFNHHLVKPVDPDAILALVASLDGETDGVAASVVE